MIEEEKDEWQISEKNDEIWIEDLKNNETFEINVSLVIVEVTDGQHENNVTIKIVDGGSVTIENETYVYVFNT